MFKHCFTCLTHVIVSQQNYQVFNSNFISVPCGPSFGPYVVLRSPLMLCGRSFGPYVKQSFVWRSALMLCGPSCDLMQCFVRSLCGPPFGPYVVSRSVLMWSLVRPLSYVVPRSALMLSGPSFSPHVMWSFENHCNVNNTCPVLLSKAVIKGL